ncbi:ArnT family glycosyltransferase [Amycolatopsis suaedae]|uniref:Phospholipid carrier-dependent glycosyltransferase n=1 Tax=Amycolatopsis suaedae TaxID=2510978 RepID=A0A4Q7IZP3_9PSEU|nr:glycosyltransferase family 39 protein [Amycolatopsis suaedae]RZQ60531.1 phospholipid carrier-dependent glycosyltransferase [Amycolatopsis suaedae]
MRYRVLLWTLLAGTAVLYLWDLGDSGWANDFYAAAAQAGSQDWTAWFFGSLDPGNTVSVDKPPAALWVMGLSGRLFGFSSWSMLVPQALMGVASVALTCAAVRRWSGPAAGLIAGAVLALTPVAAVVFRYNNPDALLVLLLVAAAYCVVRALERGHLGWLLLAGTAIGFGFLTKMMQAFLVLPAFALVYLVAAPHGIWRRLAHLAAAGAAVVVSAGWFVVVADLWPAGNRPYIGGSADNTVLDLALGYNGLGRIFGRGGGGGGGAPGNLAFGGETGLGRMFGDAFGGEISWLLPAALIVLAGGLWFTRRAPRTDRTRAALLLWGGWLVVTGLVFSLMRGITHPYYAVALAPAIGALTGIGATELWRGRDHRPARLVLALAIGATAMWGYVLLDRYPGWQPWVRWTVLVAGLAVGTAVAVGAHQFRRAGIVVAAAALLAGSGATGGFAAATAATSHDGTIPMSGPRLPERQGAGPRQAGPELIDALRATTEDWAAATDGAQSAGGLQLSSGRPVMPIGGFSGRDPAPTLEQFQQYVAQGRIHYFVPGGGPGGRGGPGGGSRITDWVTANFPAETIGGRTVYVLVR